jgi:SH3-like domain-containing protein
MQPDVPMMNGEGKGKTLGLIPEGTTIKIEEEKGEWIQISLPDGRSGWIQAGTISKI